MIPIEDYLLFQECVKVWGITSQILMAIEEMTELNLTLCHSLRVNKPFDLNHITEELADTYLMLDQIKYMLHITEPDLLKWRRKKIAKLKKLLVEEEL